MYICDITAFSMFLQSHCILALSSRFAISELSNLYLDQRLYTFNAPPQISFLCVLLVERC